MLGDFLILVPGAGIEPAWPKPQDFKSCASTNSATRAMNFLSENCKNIITTRG